MVGFHRTDTIHFQVFVTLHRMSITEFSIGLGLYNVEFARTLAYDLLLIAQLGVESQGGLEETKH